MLFVSSVIVVSAFQMKEHKLDLFQTLNKLSVKDQKFFHGLSDEEKKDFLPLILMRWMSGTKDPRQIIFLNELANPYVFALHKYKDILADLLTISSSGSSQRYTWLKVKSKKGTKTPTACKVIAEYYGYNQKHAQDALNLLTVEQILAYAEQLGYQSDEIAKIKKEMKTLNV